MPRFVSARFARNLSEPSNNSYLVFESREEAERFISVSCPSPERSQARDNAGVSLIGPMTLHEVLVDVDNPVATIGS